MIRWSYLSGPGELLNDVASSVKWSDPGHFLESQGNFFCHFHVPFFYIFLTPRVMDETLQSFLGRSILHYYQIRNIQIII